MIDETQPNQAFLPEPCANDDVGLYIYRVEPYLYKLGFGQICKRVRSASTHGTDGLLVAWKPGTLAEEQALHRKIPGIRPFGVAGHEVKDARMCPEVYALIDEWHGGCKVKMREPSQPKFKEMQIGASTPTRAEAFTRKAFP